MCAAPGFVVNVCVFEENSSAPRADSRRLVSHPTAVNTDWLKAQCGASQWHLMVRKHTADSGCVYMKLKANLK